MLMTTASLLMFCCSVAGFHSFNIVKSLYRGSLSKTMLATDRALYTSMNSTHEGFYSSTLKERPKERTNSDDQSFSSLEWIEALEELKKYREDMEADLKKKTAQMKKKAPEQEAIFAQRIGEHKKTLEEHTQRILSENLESMNEIKAEHDAELKSLHKAEAKAEAKAEEMTRVIEKEQKELLKRNEAEHEAEIARLIGDHKETQVPTIANLMAVQPKHHVSEIRVRRYYAPWQNKNEKQPTNKETQVPTTAHFKEAEVKGKVVEHNAEIARHVEDHKDTQFEDRKETQVSTSASLKKSVSFAPWQKTSGKITVVQSAPVPVTVTPVDVTPAPALSAVQNTVASTTKNFAPWQKTTVVPSVAPVAVAPVDVAPALSAVQNTVATTKSFAPWQEPSLIKVVAPAVSISTDESNNRIVWQKPRGEMILESCEEVIPWSPHTMILAPMNEFNNKLLTHESEMKAPKKLQEDLKVETKAETTEHQAEITRYVEDHKKIRVPTSANLKSSGSFAPWQKAGAIAGLHEAAHVCSGDDNRKVLARRNFAPWQKS